MHSGRSVETRPKNSEPGSERFSLHGLSAAFARLTGAEPPQSDSPDLSKPFEELDDNRSHRSAEVLSPRMLVEGMLFVGGSRGQPLTSRQIAANIRDVTAEEVDSLVSELNATYLELESPYEIAIEEAGYQFRLRKSFDELRRRFLGRARQAKLTPAAIEVLSIVAYCQPTTASQVKKLRNAPSKSILSLLLRRGLLHIDEDTKKNNEAAYRTTGRFNRIFGIESASDLPRSEDLDDD